MQDLKQFMAENPKNKRKLLVKKNQAWVDYLKNKYPFSQCLNEQLYLFDNQMDHRPMCPVHGCANHVNWINTNHYGITCSQACSQKYKNQTGRMADIQRKMQATCVDRYGVPNATQNPQIIDKRNNTMIERYDSLVSPNTRESARARARDMNKKAQETIKTKYGVDNVSQIPGVVEKKINTIKTKYNVHHPSLIPAVREKRHNKKLERYSALAANTATILAWNSASGELKDLYENPNPRITFKCEACHNIEEIPMETFKWRSNNTGTPCIKCSQINKGSLQEKQICAYVQSLGLRIIENDRKILHPNEIDIVIPELGIAIEYCGLYWHSELKGSLRNRHVDKLLACESKGLKLITIFEDEWLNKTEVVKNRLRNLFRLNRHKIGARSLRCEHISSKIANKFCNMHHIQGAGRTNHAYGLFSDDQLVSVMTFSQLNRAKGSKSSRGVWELNRFCNIPDTTIMGGASKLFSKAVEHMQPEQIISYSDRRWNTGEVYQRLGFSLVDHTPPNYWYIDFKEMKRIHRYSLRKNNKDDPQLTEWENRQIQGWNRIWDCGHTKWTWNKKEE